MQASRLGTPTPCSARLAVPRAGSLGHQLRGKPLTAPAAGASARCRQRVPTYRRRLHVRAEASEPFQPERTFHKGVVEPPEVEPPVAFGLTFADVYYYLNIGYWSLLLVSVLTGNDLVSRIVHFENYTTAMFVSSALITLYSSVKFFTDLRQHLKAEARRDWRMLLRYGWNAVFWLGFVLWYAAPPVASFTDYTGTPGMVMSLFGAALALAAALQVGHYSFMGQPQVPRKLETGGMYALLRHPQALGNMLFLIGFSLAGGALWASLCFVAAFALYIATVLPVEERMLREAFGDKHERYVERTPRFAWALVLLLVVECTLLWRFQPWAVPIDATPLAAVFTGK